MTDATGPMAIVLAAGKSTRMKSQVPKVLHPICGRPMIEYVLDAARGAGVTRIVVVVGHKAEQVRAALASHTDIEFATQEDQRGTGHAVMMCDEQLASQQGPVLILAGDTPLLKPESLAELLDQLRTRQAACVIGSAVTSDNQGLGRIVRHDDGRFDRIVEERDATAEEKQITEINTGCYAFNSRLLRDSLHQIRPDNSQAEYYLTDCPTILQGQGHEVAASPSLDIHEAMGVNTRVQLAEVSSVLRREFAQQLMTSGVTIVDPASTYIELTVTVGIESVIHPFTTLRGTTRVGSNCIIGPYACLDDAEVADGEQIAPFTHR